MHTIKLSTSLDPDQARHFVGPDLGQYCFQMLPADDTSTVCFSSLIAVHVFACPSYMYKYMVEKGHVFWSMNSEIRIII